VDCADVASPPKSWPGWPTLVAAIGVLLAAAGRIDANARGKHGDGVEMQRRDPINRSVL